MKASFRLGRVMGIEIGIHVSWLIIFALLTWSLAAAYYPQLYPGWGSLTYWTLGVLSSLLLFASVLAHELGHSWVAIRRGIPVKSITLFIFGGAASITKEAETPSSELFMAVSGPAVSFALALIFWLVYFLTQGTSEVIGAMALYLAQINAILGAFNLVPGFPLDGGRVLRAVIWGMTKNFHQATKIASATGQGFAYFLIFGGIATAFIVGWLGGLWLAFIGWFLATAAKASYRQMVVSEILRGASVREIMSSDFKSIEPNVSLQQALDDYMMPFSQRALPVSQWGRLLGLITLTDIKKTPRQLWSSTPVSEVMTRTDELKTVSRDDDLNTVLQCLQSQDLNQLPVMQAGELVGMVTRSDLIRYLQLRQEIDVRAAAKGADKQD